MDIQTKKRPHATAFELKQEIQEELPSQRSLKSDAASGNATASAQEVGSPSFDKEIPEDPTANEPTANEPTANEPVSKEETVKESVHDSEDAKEEPMMIVPETIMEASTCSSPISKKKNGASKGRHGDPRMHRAVANRLMNPELSLLEALIEGGFSFPNGTGEGTGKSDRNIFDSDSVLLCQRKNQLSRRLRLAKKRQQAFRNEGSVLSINKSQQNDSRILQNMLLNGQLPMNGAGAPMMPRAQQATAPFFPAQAGSIFDNASLQANGAFQKRQLESQYLQQLAAQAQSLGGLQPGQFQQPLQLPNSFMFNGFNGMGNPFPPYGPVSQTPQNFYPPMGQQNGNNAAGNGATETGATNGQNGGNGAGKDQQTGIDIAADGQAVNNATGASTGTGTDNEALAGAGTEGPANVQNMMPMPAIANMQQQQQQLLHQQAQFNISQMLLNGSLPNNTAPTPAATIEVNDNNNTANASSNEESKEDTKSV